MLKTTHCRAVWLCGVCMWLSLSVVGCSSEEPAVDALSPDAGLDAAEADPGCVLGALGCGCDAGVCNGGRCGDGGLCEACPPGEAGCACQSNGACDADLRCVAELCAPCEAGSEGCGCDDSACDDGLECERDVCVEAGCMLGSEGCACDSGETCVGALYCDDNTLCRACADDVPGCPCGAGACSGGLVCGDDDHCRDAVTCEQLAADGRCGQHQACEDAPGRDARCDPAGCASGYDWDDDAGVCDVEPEGVVEVVPNCDLGAAGSLVETCAAKLRECVDGVDGASCGACRMGTSEAGGQCVPLIDCGGTVCGLNEYCDGGACQPLPCDPGQAKNGLSDQCESCAITCGGEGLTGRVWPFQNSEDECICETADGYYMPTDSNTAPERCDADGDGWVRKEADTDQLRADPAHSDNARCQVLSADGVMLHDEYGIAIEVGSCGVGEGLVLDPGGAGAGGCSDRIPMRLLESERNDIPGEAVGDSAPVYDHLAGVGAGGRRLEARELSALTKACVTSLGDFNDNGENDLTEQQARPVQSDDDQARLQSFSYFTELYRAWYADGKLHIAARSRCDLSEFFLQYDSAIDTAPYDARIGASNWRTCTRRRSAGYSEHAPGFDFGQWTCPATAGACDAPPPAHPSEDATGFDHTDKLLRHHGLCELGGKPPADGIWRGMNHHSQFRCVQIDDVGSVQPPRYNSAAFEGAARRMVLNVCEATGGPVPTHSGADTYAPELSCEAQLVNEIAAGISVAWAAVTFQPYGDVDPLDGDGYGPNGATRYEAGCISEDAEWGEKWLCNYPSFALGVTDRNASFGRYSCGDERAFLWADDSGANHGHDSTLYWDGKNAVDTLSVFR